MADVLLRRLQAQPAAQWQSAGRPRAVGDTVFWWTMFFAYFCRVGLTEISPCKVSASEVELWLRANYLCIALHLIFAVALLRARLGGLLVGFSLIGGTLFLFGVVACGDAWPHPGQGWFFWSLVVGVMGIYVMLSLIMRWYLHAR